ncbi:unnamed protein product [Eruca vesicaria subsp. sativa]|uniref:Uncharacterized protein n=1 Tax=Eruca vesicaria subsp. sativa TaxID=29727 RepID=A0ABC8KUD0_ERUVS|nr:unnamed protein product [Eruca vesicaria subsp. sativa]
MSRGNYVALNAQQNQALGLGYVKVCIRRTNFFRPTPIVGVNYWETLISKITSIAAQILPPS